jgi:hypothetical protein
VGDDAVDGEGIVGADFDEGAEGWSGIELGGLGEELGR